MMVQSLDPWFSSKDIDSGRRWNSEIAGQLSETKFGILCITPENQTAPWILFEAGALAKTLDIDTYVCPYLIKIEKSQLIQGPLISFQAKEANKNETWDLVVTLNNAVKANKERGVDEAGLKPLFDFFWPQLEAVINDLPDHEAESPQRRRERDDRGNPRKHTCVKKKH